MKRISIPLYFLVFTLLAACGQSGDGYVVLTPLSPVYQKLEIRIEKIPETANSRLDLTFTGRNEDILGFSVRTENGAVLLEQAMPLAGFEEGETVTPDVLRSILIAEEIVSAGQYKVGDAGRLVALFLELGAPDATGFTMPIGYQLEETNLNLAPENE